MNWNLFPVRKDGKYGFIDDKGQVVIDFSFDSASSFSEGLGRVGFKDKRGYIDTKGNFVITPEFDSADDFTEGRAAIQMYGLWGYIDTKGNVVIIPQFLAANRFHDGLAHVVYSYSSGPKGTFIDKSGRAVIEAHLLSRYTEGLINCSKKGKWGFMDISGHWVIPPKYEDAYAFSEEKAAVSRGRDKYGFINKRGEEIIPCLFKGADIKFSENRCAVFNKHYGYIDEKGTLVIPHIFLLCWKFL